jgi:hypothetical protein
MVGSLGAGGGVVCCARQRGRDGRGGLWPRYRTHCAQFRLATHEWFVWILSLFFIFTSTSTNARALPRILKFHFSIHIYNSQFTLKIQNKSGIS